jgi:hypothetical protein
MDADENTSRWQESYPKLRKSSDLVKKSVLQAMGAGQSRSADQNPLILEGPRRPSHNVRANTEESSAVATSGLESAAVRYGTGLRSLTVTSRFDLLPWFRICRISVLKKSRNAKALLALNKTGKPTVSKL